LHQERKLEALRSRPLPPRFAEVAIVTKMACVGADVRRRPAHYCPSACCPEPVAAITPSAGLRRVFALQLMGVSCSARVVLS
jgi:hypothetical protein